MLLVTDAQGKGLRLIVLIDTKQHELEWLQAAHALFMSFDRARTCVKLDTQFCASLACALSASCFPALSSTVTLPSPICLTNRRNCTMTTIIMAVTLLQLVAHTREFSQDVLNRHTSSYTDVAMTMLITKQSKAIQAGLQRNTEILSY